MPLQCSGQKAFGSGEVAPLAELELHCGAVAVDGAVEINPTTSDLDVCLVDVPPAGDDPLVGIEALQKFGRVPGNPSVNGHVIDRDAALSHHLL